MVTIVISSLSTSGYLTLTGPAVSSAERAVLSHPLRRFKIRNRSRPRAR